VEVVASLSQGRTAAAQCSLFTHKSVPVIFEPPCKYGNTKSDDDNCFYTILTSCSSLKTEVFCHEMLVLYTFQSSLITVNCGSVTNHSTSLFMIQPQKYHMLKCWHCGLQILTDI